MGKLLSVLFFALKQGFLRSGLGQIWDFHINLEIFFLELGLEKVGTYPVITRRST